MKIDKSYSNALTKLLSSDIITKTYPMVEKIEALYTISDRTGVESIDLYVHLNDPSIKSSNMYEKEFDPHYLVDYHIRGLLNVLDIPKRIKIFTEVLNTKGYEIISFDY